MKDKFYLSISIHKEYIVSVTGVEEKNGISFFQPRHIPHQPDAIFDPETQINDLKSKGYDVWTQIEKNTIKTISAIPKNSRYNHAEWMSTCVRYIDDHKTNRPT